MKKILFILYFLSSLPAFSQQYKFCEIVATAKFLNPNKVTIQVDYGHERTWGQAGVLVDTIGGKKMEFNSLIDALNMMVKHDWEFVQAYSYVDQNQKVIHYLLKKEINKK